jgi:hypothetical protein
MIEDPKGCAQIAHRLELVCAEIDVIGKAPWSLRAELLDRWLELFQERAHLRGLLGEDGTFSV